jgi:hypothetical protein
LVAAAESPRVRLPPLPLEGGCSCGAVRYRVTAVPLTFYLCHCTECQRHTSSAFGESLRVNAACFEAAGNVRLIEREAASGRRRQGWFCPVCGVRIWHGATGSDEINIKAGTLDDTRWLVPAGHIWVQSKQPFVVLEPGALVYEGQPETGYVRLKRRWAQLTGRATDAGVLPGE